MRNSIKFLLFMFFIGTALSAQVKIGDNPQNIDPSSVLELESTDKVLVITRVTTAQMNAIVPNQGALCYNIDLQSVHYFNGTQWVNISGSGGGPNGTLTDDPIVNNFSTIEITPTATGNNFEVRQGSISTEHIANSGITGIDIADGSIVGSDELRDRTVTGIKLSENSVGAFALDNANIGVSAFNNDVGYITSGDLGNVVSDDPGNALSLGSTGGAFYNDANLLGDIMDNADAIAAHVNADNDQSATNERQNLLFNSATNILSLTTPATAGNQVNLSSLAGAGGTDNQNLTLNGNIIEIEDGNTIDLTPILSSGSGTDNQNLTLNGNIIEIEDGNTIDLTPILGGSGGNPSDLNFDETTNILTLSNPATAGNEIDLSSLAGGAGADDQTLSEVLAEGNDGNAALIKNIADPEDPQDAATKAYVDATVTSGGSLTDGRILVGGAGDAAQQLLLNGDATLTNTAELSINDDVIESTNILNATILAEDLSRMGATDGQVMVWEDDDTDPDPEVGAWVPATAGGASANEQDIALDITTDQINLLNDDTTINTSVKLDGISIEGINNGTDDVIQIKDDGVTADKLDRMGAADGQVMVWEDDDTDPDPEVGAWVPATAGGASANEQDIALDITTDQINLLNDDTTINTSVKLDGISIEGINNGTDDVIQIKDDGVTADKLDRMGAADGQVMVWEDDDTDPDPEVGAWVASTNAGHTGTANEIFFADATTGAPTGTNGLIWNPTAINNGFPALGIGLDGIGVQSTKAKVHIMERYNTAGDPISYGIQLQNRSLANNTAVGMIFSVDEHTKSYGKGALVFERTGGWAVGDFHFLQNNATGPGTDVNPTLTDKAFTITSDKDIGIYGGIDIGGAGNGFGLNNQVLASGGPGAPVKWVTSGGSNLSTDDLTQESGENRTYNLNGQNLFFTGAGNIGVGTITPGAKFHVSGGQVRAATFSASNGDLAYRFSDDPDTGMYSTLADDIGFKTGNQEILLLSESVANGLEITAKGSLELDQELIDLTGDAGDAGQILSSTGAGVEWISPKLIATGKANGGSPISTTGGSTGGTNGNYTVTFTNNAPDTNYIIQLTVQGDYRIYVSAQRTDGFDVVIIDNATNLPTIIATEWFYTATNL